MQTESNEVVTVGQLLNFQLLETQGVQYSGHSTELYLKLVESSLHLTFVLQEQFYLIFPSILMSINLSLPLKYSEQNFICVSYLPG